MTPTVNDSTPDANQSTAAFSSAVFMTPQSEQVAIQNACDAAQQSL